MSWTSSERGRLNRLAGEAFETWLDLQHERAGNLGILAHVVHNEAHSKLVHGSLIYSGAGVSDYTGVLHGGGTLALEAKSTSDARLARSEVKPAQAAHLDAVRRAGGNGLALLLVEFRTSQRRYAVPWAKVPWVKLRTADSVAEETIQEWIIAEGSCYLARFHRGSDYRYVVGAAKMQKRMHPRE